MFMPALTGFIVFAALVYFFFDASTIEFFGPRSVFLPSVFHDYLQVLEAAEDVVQRAWHRTLLDPYNPTLPPAAHHIGKMQAKTMS